MKLTVQVQYSLLELHKLGLGYSLLALAKVHVHVHMRMRAHENPFVPHSLLFCALVLLASICAMFASCSNCMQTALYMYMYLAANPHCIP